MKKFIVGTLLLLSGCASIFSGTSTTINIVSSDTSATDKIKVEMISKSGTKTLSLPTIVTVEKGSQPISIIVKDKCYRETTYLAHATIDPMFLGDILGLSFFLLGTTSISTDSLTGAMWTYDSEVIVPVVSNGTCK